MAIGKAINRLRLGAKMTQEQFATAVGVSHQAVQKWESGESLPTLDKLMKISGLFGVTVDALLFESDMRIVEEMENNKKLYPNYENMYHRELYSCTLADEYRQCVEEGKDVSAYRDIFEAVQKMPRGANREKMADIVFDIVLNAKQVEGYPYREPSDLEGIKALRDGYSSCRREVSEAELKKKIHGAWMGRVCGCLLGKPIEGIRSEELTPMLRESGNYPMRRYIRSSDISENIVANSKFRFGGKCYIDTVSCMPVDDDTNYTVMAQEIINTYGRDFTALDIAKAWQYYQRREAYCTAERVAFRNFVNGYEPPESAIYKNPYREWVGAQIRGDYFGYINPGQPSLAAEMAFRDACISHTKNGIYGEMFVAAMIACAAVSDSMEDIILGGLAQIPSTSRLYEAVSFVLGVYRRGGKSDECMRRVHELYDEHTTHGWCHTISNAMIVTMALLWGENDFGKSICLAVQSAFDTDCNGATVGSVLGMKNGIDSIHREWYEPINDTIDTTLFGIEAVKISECVEKTMAHMPDKTFKAGKNAAGFSYIP